LPTGHAEPTIFSAAINAIGGLDLITLKLQVSFRYEAASDGQIALGG